MASEKSLYRKIQLVLGVANVAPKTTLKDLVTEVESQKLPAFNTLQYDPDKDQFSWRVSRRVIRRTVSFCYRLGLVTEDGQLTRDGRQALRKTQFDIVLADRTRIILSASGIVIGKLNKTIEESLQSNPPALPTAKTLWSAAKTNMKVPEFSRLLTLLSHCGAAQSSQSKLYLTFKAE